MDYLYTFNEEPLEVLLSRLADNVRRRRLEKGWTRADLSQRSGVPAPTIAHFESAHTISLASFVALARALGYKAQLDSLLSEPLFDTMEDIDLINKNKTRRRGTRSDQKARQNAKPKFPFK